VIAIRAHRRPQHRDATPRRRQRGQGKHAIKDIECSSTSPGHSSWLTKPSRLPMGSIERDRVTHLKAACPGPGLGSTPAARSGTWGTAYPELGGARCSRGAVFPWGDRARAIAAPAIAEWPRPMGISLVSGSRLE